MIIIKGRKDSHSSKELGHSKNTLYMPKIEGWHKITCFSLGIALWPWASPQGRYICSSYNYRRCSRPFHPQPLCAPLHPVPHLAHPLLRGLQHMLRYSHPFKLGCKQRISESV